MNKKIMSALIVALLIFPMLSTFTTPVIFKIVSAQQATPTLTLSASSGFVHNARYASRIYVTGAGFDPSADVPLYWTAVGALVDVDYITLGGAARDYQSIIPAVAGAARTDGTGWFKVRIQVPQVPGGVYNVKALTAVTAKTASASFTVNPRILVYRDRTGGPTNGYVGENILYSVSGFKAGEVVALVWSTVLGVPWITTAALANGYFQSGLVAVPISVGGTQTISATGDLGTTGITSTFTVNARITSVVWTSMVAGAGAANPILGANLAGSGFTGSNVLFVKIVNLGTDATTQTFTCAGLGATVIGAAGLGTAGQFALGVIPTVTPVAPATVKPGLITCQIVTNTATFTLNDISDGTLTAAQQWLASTAGGGSAVFFRTASGLATSQNVKVGAAVALYGVGFTGASSVTIAAGTSSPIAAGANQRLAQTIPFVFDNTITQIVAPPSFAAVVADRTAEARTTAGVAFTFTTAAAVNYLYIGRVDRAWTAADVITFGGTAAANVLGASAVASWTGAWTADAAAVVTAFNAATATITLGAGTVAANALVTSIGGHAAYWLEFTTTGGAAGQFAANYITIGFTLPSAAAGVAAAAVFDAATTDANGAFFATFQVAPQPLGALYVAGAGYGAGYATVSGTVTLNIVPALYNNALTVDSVLVPGGNAAGTARVGDALNIIGQGFVSEASTVSVNGVGTSPPTQIVPNAIYGDFPTAATVTLAFVIQAGTANLATDSITVTGSTAGNTASATFTLTPTLLITTPAGPGSTGIVGATLVIAGTGLDATTNYAIKWGAADHVNTTLTTGTSTAAGTLTVNALVPDGIGGLHLIDIATAVAPTTSLIYGLTVLGFAAGVTMYPSAGAVPLNVQFTITPSQTSTPGGAAVGATVTVTSKGLAYKTNYYIWFGPAGSTVLTAGAVLSNEFGTVVHTFTVPNCTGAQRVHRSTSAVTDTSTGTLAVDRTAFAPVIALSINPGTGARSSTVNVLGTGLTTGTQYQVYWYLPSDVQTPGNIPNTATAMTAITGGINGAGTGSFLVPATATEGATYKVDLSTSAVYPVTCLTVGVPSFVVTSAAGGIGLEIYNVFSAAGTVGFMGTGNIYDDSSLGFMYARRNPPKVLFTKTDSARINQATGAPTWSDYTHLVMVGGRAANPTLAYYEDNGLATLKFWVEGGNYVIKKGATVVYTIVPSSVTTTNDYFIMEVITDGTHKVISLWGIGEKGTYAAGVYFDGKYTDLASLSAGYYVVQWTGTYPPVYPTQFTVVASGS